MNGSKCSVPDCDKVVDAFIGFDKPMAKVNPGGGRTGRWWTMERQIDGVAVWEAGGNVITLILDEDSRLHGKDK